MPPTSTQPPTFLWATDRALRIQFENSDLILPALRLLHSASIPSLLDITPAYSTLLLTFDPFTLDPTAAESSVTTLLKSPLPTSAALPSRTIEIPTCYDPRCAPDLLDLAAIHSITLEHLIHLHSSATYSVAFIGFTPGFPYLRGLPSSLSTPRLPAPRPLVTAGSVAIAADQCGIYPAATPGGWRIIGRTPLSLFDPQRTPPSLLNTGDNVRFIPIDFETLESSYPDVPPRSTA